MKITELFIILYVFKLKTASTNGAAENKTDSLPQLKTNVRIIGGRKTEIEDHPFMACIVIEFQKDPVEFICGASIIHKNWALTAAHCFDDEDINELIEHESVYVRSNTSFWKKNYGKHLVTKVTRHNKYNETTEDYDIALLKVAQPFTLKYEQPIGLPPEKFQYETGSVATVLGWGTIKPRTKKGGVVEQLRGVDLTLTDHTTCKKSWSEHGSSSSITKRMVCTFLSKKDACINDSGGPLYQGNILIGIVSFGPDVCAHDELPGVFTNVFLFRSWIRQRLR